MVMKRARVELIIDELVLHGFSPGDRRAIGDAVQSQLETLLAEQAIAPARDISIDRLAAQQAIVAPGAKAQTIGSKIGRAIHGGLPR